MVPLVLVCLFVAAFGMLLSFSADAFDPEARAARRGLRGGDSPARWDGHDVTGRSYRLRAIGNVTFVVFGLIAFAMMVTLYIGQEAPA